MGEIILIAPNARRLAAMTLDETREGFRLHPTYFNAVQLQRAKRRMAEFVNEARSSFKAIEGDRDYLDTIFRLDWMLVLND